MKGGIVNDGMGNQASVFRAVETIGFAPFIANDPAELRDTARIILPGVGAFTEGMDRLDRGEWTPELKRLAGEEGRPLLGICLGMQFLAERGAEGGQREGLGFVPGTIEHLSATGCTERIPHVGWNEVRICRDDPLMSDIPDRTDFYFVHSFVFQPAANDDVVGTADYGCDVTAVIRRGNVWGTQFHPEKSSKAGLQLLRNFIERS